MNIRLKATLLTLAAPVAMLAFVAVLLVSTYTSIRDELLAEQRLRE